MISGGDQEEVLGDLPPLELNASGEEELHEEEVELEVHGTEEVGLDTDASGDQILDPAQLLHAPDPAEGSSIGEGSFGVDGEDVDDDLVGDSAEYGWTEFGNSPTGDDDWDDGFHAISSSPSEVVEDLGEAGLEEEGADEALSLPPLDADESDDDWEDEGDEIEGFLRLEDAEAPIGAET